MLCPILAQVEATGINNYVVIGIVAVGLGTLASLGVSIVTLQRFASGKANERQIEPTQLAAIQTEMRSQTSTLNNINREVGEVRSTISPLATDVAGLHQRVGGISRELAHTVARVEGLERHESHNS